VIFEVPYSSIIMAKERMDYYAVVGIIDVLLKLGVAIILPYLPYDKLISYSFLNLIITLANFFLYFIYAKYNFPILKLKRLFDKELFRSMLSFSGWNVIGTFAFMLKGQGLNLLLNFFFGPVVNAARGISYQVLSAMQGFTANISIAFRPQLITSYAEGNIERTRKMMYSESKICYVLMGALVTPLIIEMDYVLHLWLGGIVPEYTVPFTILVLLDMLIGTLNTPFTQVVHATGNLKTYQIVSTIVHCLIIPIAWLLLKFGYSPVSSFVVSLAMAMVNQIGCMLVVRNIFPYGLKKYLVQIILPCLLYTVLLPLLPLMIYFVMEQSFARLALICLVDFIAAITIAFFAVLNKDEKSLLLNFVRRS